MNRIGMLLISLVLILAFSSPAYGTVQGEWEGSFALSDPVAGDGWYWSTGLRLTGDWALGGGFNLTLRGSAGINSLTDEFDAILERGYIQYENGPCRIKLGRLAVGWGTGWFFRPTDLITPLSPLSPEEGRPGRDLLTFTWATSDLTDVELIAGEDLYAARAGWQLDRTSLRVLGLCEPDGRKTLGFDIQGGLGGFYSEACCEWTDDLAGGKLAALVGWKRVLGDGLFLYLEYLRDERYRFHFGQDYLAAGLEYSRDELTTYTVAAVGNLGDGGTMLMGMARYLLSDNFDLQGAVGLILGPEGTEFLTLAGGSRVSLSLGAKYYF